MRFEKTERINPFEIALAEKTLTPLNFMRMLLKVAEIAKNKQIVAFIKEIIKEIKEHIQFARVSHKKGEKRRYQSQEKVGYDYYDIQNTKTYDAQLKALFLALGVSEIYRDPERQREYLVFREFFSKEELQSCKLSSRGLFVVRGREYKLMTDDMYQKYELFEREYFEKYGVDQDAHSVSKDVGDVRYHVVKADNRVYKAFEQEVLGIKEEPIISVHEKDTSPEINLDSETQTEEQSAETPIDKLDTSYRKVEKEEQKAFKQAIFDIAQKRPGDLNLITTNITIAKSLVLGETKNGIFVRMPHTYINQDDPLRDAVMCVPKKFVYRRFENGGLSINLPMNALWFRFNEKDDKGKFTSYLDDTGEPVRISALEVLKSFNIGKIRALTELDLSPELYIDGQPMRLVEENGFKYAYNSERAVVLEYTGEDKDILIPSTIRAGGLDIPVKEIKDGAFKCNDHIESVTFSDNLNEVCTRAFAGCRSLKVVNNAEVVKSWGDSVFYNCFDLKDITLTSYVKTIGVNIFECCKSMEQFKVRGDGGLLATEDGVLIIGKDNLYAFPPAKEVEGSFQINASTVLDNAFREVPIQSVTFKNECHVCTNAFTDCAKLKEVNIEKTIRVDGKSFECAKVESVDLDKVTGADAFAKCPIKTTESKSGIISEEQEKPKEEPQQKAKVVSFTPDIGH